MNNLNSQFLLDPEVIFLNHGSFGATPKPVSDTCQGYNTREELDKLVEALQSYLKLQIGKRATR
ncbi:MAG: hypothetical protein GQ562_01250 [Anaerolineales bacterium]|nr:hypothetical protein [Anaerolineales bacterium]